MIRGGGERLGSLGHFVSFWRYRCPEGRSIQVNGEELADPLSDFEASLAIKPSTVELI
ncbi:MAG: hypothetical protein WCP82_07375 [Alphaproteobacteria bacterium]